MSLMSVSTESFMLERLFSFCLLVLQTGGDIQVTQFTAQTITLSNDRTILNPITGYDSGFICTDIYGLKFPGSQFSACLSDMN